MHQIELEVEKRKKEGHKRFRKYQTFFPILTGVNKVVYVNQTVRKRRKIKIVKM